MNEPKPFASLSSGLLARKGLARPAMRPQGFGQAGAAIDDLGWNDMGAVIADGHDASEEDFEARLPSPITALTPMLAGLGEEEDFEPAPPVVEQQRAAIEAHFAGDDAPVLATKSRKPAEMAEPADEPVCAEMPAPPEIPAVMGAPVAEEDVRTPAPAAASPMDTPVASSPAARAKAAFTLRLDGERHLKLRLACAVSGRSAQQLVTEALDRLLESRPDVEALAGQVPGQGRDTK